MLDPTKNATFEILDALFSELAEMFEGEDSPFVCEMRARECARWYIAAR